MHKFSLSEFEDAVDCMGLISLTSKKQIRNRYLELSKIYHPDIEGGDAIKFTQLKNAYEVLQEYMQNFRYVLDEEEFKRQNPILVSDITANGQIK